MPRLIVFMAKEELGSNVYVSNFNSVEELCQFLQVLIGEADENHPRPDLATVTQMLEKVPVTLMLPKIIGNITIEAVIKFENIPNGRSLDEIIGAMYYACGQLSLLDGVGIKYGKHTLRVLSDPKEALDPKTFNWNISELIHDYVAMLWISSFFDFHPVGSLYSHIDDLETQVKTVVTRGEVGMLLAVSE